MMMMMAMMIMMAMVTMMKIKMMKRSKAVRQQGAHCKSEREAYLRCRWRLE